MDEMDVRVPVEEFNSALWKRFHDGKIRNVYPLFKYKDIIEKIKSMEANPPCNTPGEYYLLRKFIVVNINGKERLSCKPENFVLSENSQNRSSATKFYVALEEIHTYLDEAHKWVKHGCRDRLLRKVQGQGIVNITRETVELFLSFCKFCRPRNRKVIKILKSDPKTVSLSNLQFEAANSPFSDRNTEIENTLTHNPTTENMLNIEINPNRPNPTVCTFTRGFVDLIDFSFSPDGDYKFVCLYMDIQTCFSVLSPVRCKCDFEIISHLISVFTLIGPPQVLHSNFESSFLHSIICELKRSLPDLVLVSGSTNYTEVQAVAQNCLAEVTEMLKTWMFQRPSSNWSQGLKVVQLKKNTKTSDGGSKSPYECFFGKPIHSNLTIDLSVLRNAEKEEDLLSVVNQQAEQPPSCEHLQVSLDPDICSLVQNHNQDDGSQTSNIKTEPDDDAHIHNFSDSSNDTYSASNAKLEIVIKQEEADS